MDGALAMFRLQRVPKTAQSAAKGDKDRPFATS